MSWQSSWFFLRGIKILSRNRTITWLLWSGSRWANRFDFGGRFGARVALIESRFMGGDCLNVGCVPSKALLESTKSETCSFDEAFEWLREIRSTISEHDSSSGTRKPELTCFWHSQFHERGELLVEDQVLRARRVALCVGSGQYSPNRRVRVV